MIRRTNVTDLRVKSNIKVVCNRTGYKGNGMKSMRTFSFVTVGTKSEVKCSFREEARKECGEKTRSRIERPV